VGPDRFVQFVSERLPQLQGDDYARSCGDDLSVELQQQAHYIFILRL
jgi:hypothetical protein